MEKNLYTILGLTKNATQEEIRKAYLLKIKKNRSTTNPDQKEFEQIKVGNLLYSKT